VSGDREKLTASQIAGMAVIGAAALGFHVMRQLSRPPGERAAEAEALRRRHAEKRAYEIRWKEAWELDRAHWKAFETDAQAQAGFEAEYYVPVDAVPVAAAVEMTRSGSMWAITDRYRVTHADDVLSFSHDLDGGFMALSLDSSVGHFETGVGAPPGRLTIGQCNGVPSPLQRKVAGLVGAMQAEGHFADRQICAVLSDRHAVLDRHYADYARARGWPAERTGEVDRVQREHYASERQRANSASA